MTADGSIHDQITKLLRDADQRYTTGRQRLVDVLLQTTAPVTIAQILASDDRLAQSSVYRNLVILEQVGAVTRIVTRDDYARYELAEELTDHHHHHFICTECGDVSDFALTNAAEVRLEESLGTAARSAGFRVQGHRLDLLGTCAACP